MKYKKSYKKIFLLIPCIFTGLINAQTQTPATTQLPAATQAPTGSSEQALEQLRMLQQRLSPATVAAAQTAAQNQSPTQSTVPRVVTTPGQIPGVGQAPVPPPSLPQDVALNVERDVTDANAFDAATSQIFPMTTEQIKWLKQLY